MPRAQKSPSGKAARKAPARRRKTAAEPGTMGLSARECEVATRPPELAALVERIEHAGGCVLSSYREPLAGGWVLLSALPLDHVEPTPYQRELSKAHAERLGEVIPKVGRFLDPIVAVASNGGFITPNGMHRVAAMKALGARAITALVVPESEVAYRILALNTEKAHNLRDKALEVVRMAHALAEDGANASRLETDFVLEFEQPSYLTLGLCYERNGRFSGGAYLPVVSRCEEFRPEPLKQTLPWRAARADKLMQLDVLVNDAVKRLKDAGFSSGYLKPVVVARINPLRFVKAAPGAPVRGDFDKTIDRMLEGARKFDPSKVKASEIALAASMGAGDEGN
jgi:ParB family chromosome partitioning protein